VLKINEFTKGKIVSWESSVVSAARPSWTYFNSLNDIIDKKMYRWLFPSKSNQPSFDAIFRVSEYHAKFIQITIKEPHSFDIDKIIPFIDAMEVHVVEFVFLCQSSNFKAFKVPAVNTTNVYSALTAIYLKQKKSVKNIPKVAISVDKCCYQKRNTYDPL